MPSSGDEQRIWWNALMFGRVSETLVKAKRMAHAAAGHAVIGVNSSNDHRIRPQAPACKVPSTRLNPR